MQLRLILTTVAAAAAAAPALAAPTPMSTPASEPADIAIIRLQPDRGGTPDDGRLWRAKSVTAAAGAETGATLTREIIANTPIPDNETNRAKYGGPRSASGRLTSPKSGPVQIHGPVYIKDTPQRSSSS